MKDRPDILIYITAVLAFGGLGAYLWWPDCFSSCRKIEASMFTNPGSPQTIYGKIQLVEATMFEGGIDSDGYGGECVFFSNPTRRCFQDKDCQLPDGHASDAHWFCSAEKQCWKNRGGNHCWRGVDQKPQVRFEVGDTHEIPITVGSIRRLFPNEPPNEPLEISAKVIACLNGKFELNGNPPCKGGTGKSKMYQSLSLSLMVPPL